MSILDSNGMRKYIVDVLEEWSIPNAIVTLVDLDKPVNDIRAFKMKSIEETVDENTVWSICSNSKLFAVVALAMLVDKGMLKWTDKIQDLVPGLALQDDYANSTLTLEDILSHQTGIPASVKVCSRRKVS
jgi:CubicO group peptidase (beta-lactamase class C family)